MAISPSNVYLYAAVEADYRMAVAAATLAGVPSQNVVGDFSTAYNLVGNSTNFVIAVGGAALNALYYNPCNWGGKGVPPYYDYTAKTCSSLPSNYFFNAAGTTAADTFYLALAYTYYAINCAFPTEFSSPPSQLSPKDTCVGNSDQTCPCPSCSSTKTFNDVCGSTSTCLSNPDVICWAKEESKQAQVPVDIILAQWIYEGAHDCNVIASNCNNPGNANSGTFSRCSTSYTAAECSSNSAYAGASTGLNGAIMNGHVFNSGYCEVATTYQDATLTTGGQELKTYAQNAGWSLTISDGTYSAAYKLGAYSPVWAKSQYTSDYIGASPSSSTPGSGLIYMIHQHNLAQYDYVY